ncbi:uncharacterized protein LOC132210833 [Stegostoma tigrinum]|uniref:uncharacterized protein LOC132210833 n=1 Tax=Stegostoma tigrinum TaxID=3053191 RepID=UPI0028700297|nr:uncharacterized protein LOC132210833 [Stegostoma tigrinum]
MMDWNNTTLDLNLRTSDWNVTTTDWNGLTVVQNVTTVDGNGKTLGRGFIEMLNSLSAAFARKPLKIRIRMILQILQFIYYPILAIAAVPANVITIVILSQEKCGLSRCVSHYLVAMAIADLLVTIFDLILRHIPFVYLEEHHFLKDIPFQNSVKGDILAASNAKLTPSLSVSTEGGSELGRLSSSQLLILWMFLKQYNNSSQSFPPGMECSKLTGPCHLKRDSSTSQIPSRTQELPHNVPAAIRHEATVGEPTVDSSSIFRIYNSPYKPHQTP